MRILLATLTLVTVTFLEAQLLNRSFQSSNGDVNLLGMATVERLREAPFNEWFMKNHEEYQVNDSILSTISLPDSITLFMGTWCGDSKLEVPRFVKILEASAFDFSKLKIICLNTGFQNYKQAPDREEAGASIHRVPTFIFQDSAGLEIGRIVEEPVVSLEHDIKTIMSKQAYTTAYPVVNDLIAKFDEHKLSDLRKMKKELIAQYKGKAKSEYALNTYGYVLWASFNLAAAEFVFELNSALYPDVATPYATLASFKGNIGKRKEAKKTVKSGLQVEPNNKRLLSMLERFNE